MVQENPDLTRQSRAVVKYLRISPRKVRLVIDQIRHKPVPLAFSVLMTLKKRAARLVREGLKSAVANAKVKNLEESRLVVSEVRADGGPLMKRFMSRSMGRADQILKRTTHLTIVLREGEKRTAGPARPSVEPEKAEKGKPKVESKPKKEKRAAQGKKRLVAGKA